MSADERRLKEGFIHLNDIAFYRTQSGDRVCVPTSVSELVRGLMSKSVQRNAIYGHITWSTHARVMTHVPRRTRHIHAVKCAHQPCQTTDHVIT